MQTPVKKLVIAGGGTAGWMAAALLKKVFGQALDVELVESEDIGIIGVGEATIPPIQIFNQYLGLDEKEFLRETHATIKLAIKFENWRVQGESYYHTFGAPGATLGVANFQHYWLRAKELGLKESLWDFDLNYLCCEQGKFNKIKTHNPVYDMPYAYHFDSALYGKYLRKLAEQAGVIRTEGLIEQVKQNPETGFVQALQLKNGREISGDLFIDCTGIRGLLIRKTLGVAYEHWDQYLPANSALAVPTEPFKQTLPYTRSIAHSAGWQWRIPLTHRNGNGIVYSSNYLSDDQAYQTLMSNLDSTALAEPKKISFETGRTTKQWHKNVVAIGLSSGFLEPLESTSIHLIQSAIVRLMKMFPNHEISEAQISAYNAESKDEFETIRDFIILHYHVNERNDSDFWRDMRQMSIPHRLEEKLALFKETAGIFNDANDIFRDSSWLQVMLGQGLQPADYHPAARAYSKEQLLEIMQNIRTAKQQPLQKLTGHDEFLALYTGQ
ncbi:MAG: tryptophan 7-halogenase [Gammaproteobacteria bacterium]|nr:tryptophan 7-halogenase [Gammaproteobacteria bacterium]MBU2059891.1 tryptophan 7-halogenase [Gammaproteobacteria bacterium]MBU2175854.1 tryptophan 7-halogenase [Gammaproteobacteria bacterium]MBU2247677.1 tryptophan 7-halogenase [Gammaproteobacteria bacterium]MBU2345980.1 tryptophan 7-halogenase [Gammaproteobacteria bacterium]